MLILDSEKGINKIPNTWALKIYFSRVTLEALKRVILTFPGSEKSEICELN